MRTGQSVLHAWRTSADSTTLGGAQAALRSAFAPIWAKAETLELELSPEAIRAGGVTVLPGDEDGEGLIQTLWDAGVRKLVVHSGAELEEFNLLLAAVASRHGTRSDGSRLLTALFRADLHHIEYAVADRETLLPDAPEDVPPHIEPSGATLSESPEAVREAVRRDVSTSKDGIVRLEQFDSTLYFLDTREIEYLKSAIDREYSQDLAINTLRLLLDVLESRPEEEVREEVIGILRDFLPELLGGGRFEAVATLLSGAREAARAAVDLTAPQKEALDRLRASISTRKALSQLFHALEGGAVAPSAESMNVLLRELRPTAVREVLTWGEKLTESHTREAVVDALDGFFSEWPHGLSRMLNAPESDVVRAGLRLAGRLKHPEFVDLLRDISGHQDQRIRREVAETLSVIATTASLRGLLGMVDDSDPDVRVVVYRTFAARPSRGAFGALKRAITESELEAQGQAEKRTLFEAFGAVAGPEGIGVLEPLLRGRNPFGRRPSPHTRACAAVGLGIIGTPAAHVALRGSENDRDPLVRSAVAAALRGER